MMMMMGADTAEYERHVAKKLPKKCQGRAADLRMAGGPLRGRANTSAVGDGPHPGACTRGWIPFRDEVRRSVCIPRKRLKRDAFQNFDYIRKSPVIFRNRLLSQLISSIITLIVFGIVVGMVSSVHLKKWLASAR